MTEGERWAREALDELRAAGPGPRGVARFLAESRRRARRNRAVRPGLARQARAWSAVGALAWALPAFAGVEPFRGRARGGLAWWGFAALMLDWHLGMVETETGEPRPLGPADACTLTRAWLVPLAAHRPGAAVLTLGFASDVLDGALARGSTPTRAGRDLEGMVDTAFTGAAMCGAVRCGWLGRLPAALEAARLLAGAGYACVSYFSEGVPPDRTRARAARASAPVRAAGLLAAALGRRRAGEVLLVAGSLAGAAAQPVATSS